MILNYIWIGFFVIAFLVAICRLFGYFFRDFFFEQFGWVFDAADMDIFQTLVNSTFDSAKSSVSIVIVLAGVMTLWLGFLKIAEKAGLIDKLARLVSPVLSQVFPEIPKGHPAMGSIMMNFSANMLGLGNAATPLGLKAMEELQTLNPNKSRASNSQIMFLVLNTSGLTIIPLSVMAIRLKFGSEAPSDVFVPILLATFCSSLVGLIVTSIVQKINLLSKNMILFIGIISALIAGFIWFVTSASPPLVEQFTSISGNLILFSIIILFLVAGFRKKLNLYETFIEGAKEGIKIAVKILPYLVAMLVSIGALKASGALGYFTDSLSDLFSLFMNDTRFTDALPVGIMRPFSGGAAEALMIQNISDYGVDSFVGKLSSTFQGSTETTFYVLAVYFGSVGIKNTRYAALCGLAADIAGIIAAIIFGYLFFGHLS